jgi:hypothetical protein
VTAALCYICIAIYGIRCCVQPMLLLFRAWPVFKGKSSFTEVWDADVRWFVSICFNTFLMLPAMCFVRAPFRDSAKTVREAYVKLGGQVTHAVTCFGMHCMLSSVELQGYCCRG